MKTEAPDRNLKISGAWNGECRDLGNHDENRKSTPKVVQYI